jgi:hypothetical protein
VCVCGGGGHAAKLRNSRDLSYEIYKHKFVTTHQDSDFLDSLEPVPPAGMKQSNIII